MEPGRAGGRVVAGAWVGIGVAAFTMLGAFAQEASQGGVRPSFTAAQAERGREAYTTSCAHCHRSDLLGDERQEIPALAEESFFVRWSGRPLQALFAMISQDMPGDKPGSLSTQAAVDIVAYILQTHGHRAGATELRADRPTLERISIEKP